MTAKSHALPIAASKFLLIAAITALVIINVQPWYSVTAPFFAKAVIHVPLLSLLVDAIAAIPWVGPPLAGLITLLCEKGADLGVLLLCALVNLSETAGMMLKLRGIEAGVITSSQGSGAKAIAQFLELLNRVRLAAYCAELSVCFAAYKIYGTGPAALLADVPNLDPELWSWPDIVMSLVTMFGFEVVLGTVLGLWSGMGVLTMLFNAEQPNPQPKKPKAE